MAVYALKVDDGWPWLIHQSLKRGEGRFGWSYVETGDLHDLRHRIAADGWDSLNAEEKDCYQELLLSLNCGDYVVYVNLPEWGQCTFARVTGKYFWQWADNDFNHRFSVDADSVRSFDRNDPLVAPALRARLKLRGRCRRVHAEEEFGKLLEALRYGVKPAPATPGNHLPDLRDEAEPSPPAVTEHMRRMGPGTDLGRLVEQVFRRVPGVRSVTRQDAVDDRGADLVVELEPGLVPELVQTLVVQVKSQRGALSHASVVEHIRRAFGAYDADMVLVVCPAMSRDMALERELDRLREDIMKSVALLVGDEWAAFILQHGADLRMT